ncbi:MAG: PilZ domain-containing protein [Nitrospirota bacterium]
MNGLVCPKCEGISYSSSENSFSGCPYCGTQFSGKYGLDRRIEKRTRCEHNCSFIFMDRTFKSQTLDISKNGLSLSVNLDLPFATGDRIDLSIENNLLSAEIVWWSKLHNESRIGLRIIGRGFFLRGQKASFMKER